MGVFLDVTIFTWKPILQLTGTDIFQKFYFFNLFILVLPIGLGTRNRPFKVQAFFEQIAIFNTKIEIL